MGTTPRKFPPPEKTPPSLIGELPGEFHEDPSDDPRRWLAGTWVTTFSSFVFDEPEDDNDLPRIATYALPNLKNTPSHGYFFAATLLCLKFDALGRFSGRVAINRGGRAAPQPNVFGTYTIGENSELDVVAGTIFATYPADDPVHMQYDFVLVTPDEIAWLRTSSESKGAAFRHNIARGTFKRVTVHRQIEASDSRPVPSTGDPTHEQ